jgi:cytochrome d ubiquinol oxidase subunit I
MSVVVWPDEKNATNAVEFGRIPGLLSLLAFKDLDREVTGLADIPAEDRPPVAITMVSFRMMVAIGLAMLGLPALTWWRRKRLSQTPLLLTALVWFVPLPFVACHAGWILTEVGRQPWIVYNVMRTARTRSSRELVGIDDDTGNRVGLHLGPALGHLLHHRWL